MDPITLSAGATALGLASLGTSLSVHHRRWLGYHRFKGLPTPSEPLKWLTAGAIDWATLGWWHVAGFLRDGRLEPSEREGRTVLCVHGYTQNATNFWGLRRVLRDAGRPSVGLSMRHRLAPVRWYAHRLERALDHHLQLESDAVDLVAHSMGGVVLRMVLSRRPDLAEGLHTVVTLGTPHRGTAAARGIPMLPEVRALKRGSALWTELPSLSELVPAGRLLSIAGTHDTIVYPVSTCEVPGARNVVIDGVGHAGLLTRPEVMELVLGHLRPAA